MALVCDFGGFCHGMGGAGGTQTVESSGLDGVLIHKDA